MLRCISLTLHFPDVHRSLESIELGHLAVHQDQVVVLLLGHFESDETVFGNIDLVPQSIEHPNSHFLVDEVVFHQENLWRIF